MTTEFAQIGWVVDDIDAAIDWWRTTAGVGPFFVRKRSRVTDATYRGEPVGSYDLTLAFTQLGGMQLELIAQHDPQRSPYNEGGFAGDRVHHFGGFVDDLDVAVGRYRARGADVVYSGRVGELRFVYVDTVAESGCMTELFERTPALVAQFATIARASATWDGSEPIRSFDE